jgi:hypothetical protein
LSHRLTLIDTGNEAGLVQMGNEEEIIFHLSFDIFHLVICCK